MSTLSRDSNDAGSTHPLLPEARKNSSLQIKINGYASPSSSSQLHSLFTPRTPRTPLLLNSEPSFIQESYPAKRNLNWSSAYILIISRVVGSGIFAAPGVIAQSTGSVGLALTLWLVGAIVAACGLTVSMELGCMLPKSGGDNVYLEFIYDRPRFLTSTIIAVQAMLLGFTASNCVVFGKYFLFAIGIEESSESLQRTCAASLLIFVTIIHARFLEGGILLQNILGWIKVAVLTFIGLAGLSVLFIRPTLLEPQSLSLQNLFAGSNWNFSSLATSFFKVSFAYSGYDNINNILSEVSNPIRTLRTAAPAALLSIFFFYLLLNISYFLVVPLDQMKASGELIAVLFFQRLFGSSSFATHLLPGLIALSAAGSVMVTTFTQARINQEIARHGFLPFSSHLARNSSYNTPIGGLILHLLSSLAVILLPPQESIYSFILELKGYPTQMTSLAVCTGLLWLRSKKPGMKRPFKAWKGAVYLPIGLNIALLLAPFFPPQKGREEYPFWYGTYAVVGVATVVIAVVYWFVWIKVLPRIFRYTIEVEQQEVEEGMWINKLVRRRKEYGYQQVDQSDKLGASE